MITIPFLLLVFGMLFSWPMTLATVAVEGSDGFDGFSRPLSYLFSKLLRFFVYWTSS
ncbi:MAG: hypothetical protein R3C11_25815 [Planctomycetaceae bacterium]